MSCCTEGIYLLRDLSRCIIAVVVVVVVFVVVVVVVVVGRPNVCCTEGICLLQDLSRCMIAVVVYCVVVVVFFVAVVVVLVVVVVRPDVLLHTGNLSFARPVSLHYCRTLGKLTDKAGQDITASVPGKRLVVNNLFLTDPYFSKTLFL